MNQHNVMKILGQNSLLGYPKSLLLALQQARHIVVFTGAGVSAESGIPTFRDALTGLWKNFDVEMLATRDAFRRDPALVWGWYEWRRKLVMRVQPNPAHLAIARMVQHVPLLTVITQNVDDLHERAGSTDVIHLHGSFITARCFACERHYVRPPDDDEAVAPDSGHRLEPPRCGHCNGKIRPGVVWFGEMLPNDAYSKAKQAIRTCDLLFSIGTSSEVFPAAILPFEAAERKAIVVQVNPSVTDLDAVAHFNLHGPAGSIMEELVRATWPE